MNREERKLRQELFIRVCKDSRFQLDYVRAAALAGAAGGFPALDVWLAMPSLGVMEEIAAGTHPACHRVPA